MELPEIMTIEEVARYLRVSERTVYDWAQKGDLPAGKLGSSWRFRRDDLQRWAAEKLQGGPRDTPPPGVLFRDILRRERIILLKSQEKTGALEELIDCLAGAVEVTDPEELARAVFRREQLMSTGIGLGIAVPHVRLESVKGLVMALGISHGGLADYESLDGGPVHILCMFATGRYQHAQYLKALAAISGRLKDPELRRKLLDTAAPDKIFQLLVGPGEPGE
ncbi:MAG: PTS sugar transporter subunit IIA [Candidatus Erginobacter occultus]|nr:PTS sugar transporter subunit IIA [Candidatus Erginobacter occultus]